MLFKLQYLKVSTAHSPKETKLMHNIFLVEENWQSSYQESGIAPKHKNDDFKTLSVSFDVLFQSCCTVEFFFLRIRKEK